MVVGVHYYQRDNMNTFSFDYNAHVSNKNVDI